MPFTALDDQLSVSLRFRACILSSGLPIIHIVQLPFWLQTLLDQSVCSLYYMKVREINHVPVLITIVQHYFSE